MFCILCRYFIKWVDPGWDVAAEQLVNELLNRGLNTGAIFEADADPARLRQIYELQHSDPAEAFAQFLSQAESGSVWSMIQVGPAYATGEGVPIDGAQAEEWFLAAYAEGSDFGLLWASNLAFRGGDSDQAKFLLKEGITRGIPRAKLDLACMERRLGHTENARILYEQAIASEDLLAEVYFAQATAQGSFRLSAIPGGIKDLVSAQMKFVEQVEEWRRSQSAVS
jgi:hypothetical protein